MNCYTALQDTRANWLPHPPNTKRSTQLKHRLRVKGWANGKLHVQPTLLRFSSPEQVGPPLPPRQKVGSAQKHFRIPPRAKVGNRQSKRANDLPAHQCASQPPTPPARPTPESQLRPNTEYNGRDGLMANYKYERPYSLPVRQNRGALLLKNLPKGQKLPSFARGETSPFSCPLNLFPLFPSLSNLRKVYSLQRQQ